MAKKNKDDVLVEGGLFSIRNPFSSSKKDLHDHKIKLAILLIFFDAELYFMEFKDSYKREFYYTVDVIMELREILNDSIKNKTSIKFSGLRKLAKETFETLSESSKKTFETLSESSNIDIDIERIAENFINFCRNLQMPAVVRTHDNSYYTYMSTFFTSGEKDNKISKYEVVKVIQALINPESTYDNNELNHESQFIRDIVGLCGCKIDLLHPIKMQVNIDNNRISYGGKKSKKQPKKEILGKTKSIHKIMGDRKEYVKHKGKLITIKDYKELMKKKK